MTKLTIVPLFISSSGDCDQERAAILCAVEQYNQSARPNQNLEVRAFGPDELFAGPGEYAQEVVNRQLQDYEIYVGLWRENLGTQTPVAPSGTVEELRNALQRYERTRRPWIMAYFWKSSPLDFMDVKDELKDRGCYYHQYNDPQYLRLKFFDHLTGYIRDQYRLPGHSSTFMSNSSQGSVLNSVLLVFEVNSPDGENRMYSFERASVAVGRQPEQNQIEISNQRVHREQVQFVWIDGLVLYVDLAGDSVLERNSQATTHDDQVAYGQNIINPSDAVVLPDGSRITLRAVVD